MSESLCSTTDNIDLTVLDKAVASGLDIRSLADIESVSRNMQTNYTEPQSEIMEKYEVAAFNVLNSTDENKISLMALYRYICYNSDWVGWALDVEHFDQSSPPHMLPWDDLPSPQPQLANIMEKIGNVSFDSLMNYNSFNWEDICHQVLSRSPSPVIAKMLQIRHPDEHLNNDFVTKVLRDRFKNSKVKVIRG